MANGEWNGGTHSMRVACSFFPHHRMRPSPSEYLDPTTHFPVAQKKKQSRLLPTPYDCPYTCVLALIKSQPCDERPWKFKGLMEVFFVPWGRKGQKDRSRRGTVSVVCCGRCENDNLVQGATVTLRLWKMTPYQLYLSVKPQQMTPSNAGSDRQAPKMSV